MLSEVQVRQALHASRVVPLAVAKPCGPLGLEQLAQRCLESIQCLGLAAPVCAGRSPWIRRRGKNQIGWPKQPHRQHHSMSPSRASGRRHHRGVCSVPTTTERSTAMTCI
jgi:hypothetical protein